MPDETDTNIQIVDDKDVEVKTKAREPIGEVIIGKVDPSTLGRSEFTSSPDLLFHGAVEEFGFLRDFDYKGHFKHSMTTGAGFYATPKRRDAELFSIAFGRKEEKPMVTEILPYEARMFDLRNRTDTSMNASVPQGMFRDYKKYIEGIHNTKYLGYDPKEDVKFVDSTLPDRTLPDFMSKAFDGFEPVIQPYSEERKIRGRRIFNYNASTKYLRSLSWLESKDSIDLREMLSISGEARISEYASEYFRQFMLDQDFDGVIYNEGGDHPEHNNPASYAFFNLDKIGTYETWHDEITIPNKTPNN